MLFTSLRCTDMNVALKIYTCRSLKHCFDYLHTDLWIDHKPTHPQWVYLFCPFQSIYMFSVHPTEKDLQTLSVSALLSFLEDHPVTKICELRVFPVSHNLVVDSPCERRSFWECLYCWWEEVWELSPLLPPPVLSLNHPQSRSSSVQTTTPSSWGWREMCAWEAKDGCFSCSATAI